MTNAIQFIQKVGIDRARDLAFDSLHPQMTHVSENGCNWINTDYPDIQVSESELMGMVDLRELRQVVESIERVKGFGGIGMVKLIDQTCLSDHMDLDQLIADHQAIYS